MGEDLALLKQHVAPSELLLGEVGFAEHGIDAIDAFRTVETLKAVQRTRLRAAVHIDGINDRGLTTVAGKMYRYYELYGGFTHGPITPTVICDGIDAHADPTYLGDSQINVRIPHDGRDRYCVFRVVRSDGTRSLAFGPKRAAAN